MRDNEAKVQGLKGRVVVVGGGAGEVGEGVVRVFLKLGATVIVPSRSKSKNDALQSAIDPSHKERLILLNVDISTITGLKELAGAVSARGRLDAVISSVGGFWSGPALVDVDARVVSEQIESRVAPHLGLIQTLGPQLSENGAFIHLSGLVALFGMPNLSALGVSAAAQLAVTRAFLAEAQGSRVYGIVIEQFVKTRSRQDLPAGSLTADEVGEAIWPLISSNSSNSMLALRKVDNGVEVEPLPLPISANSIDRLTKALSS